jgi:hypothetical protein
LELRLELDQQRMELHHLLLQQVRMLERWPERRLERLQGRSLERLPLERSQGPSLEQLPLD